MKTAAHNPNRAQGGHGPSRRHRIGRLVLFGLLLCSLAFVLFAVTDTFRVYRDVSAAVMDSDTSLRSAAGIARFCRRLQQIAQEQRAQVVLLITCLYMVLQTFCIPGTVVLNAAVGAVVGTLLGVPYCTLLGTIGASSCYLLSRAVGLSLVEAADARLMKGAGLPKIRDQVHKYRADLPVYMLFLRLTPILPNWLVNLASPVVGVPLRTFAGATALGIVPQTYLTVRFGAIARAGKGGEGGKGEEEGEGAGGIVTVWDTLLLAVIGVAVVAAFRLRKRFGAASAGAGGASMEGPLPSRYVARGPV